ncbi:hypothetical protein Tco_0810069 [Tanacetum coccineum]
MHASIVASTPDICLISNDTLEAGNNLRTPEAGYVFKRKRLSCLYGIHEARVKALKKENVKDENLHGMDKEFENRLDETLYFRRRITPMACYGRRHHHLRQQVLDVFKDEERSSKAIWFTAKVGTIAYRLEPLKQLSRVHSTFHVPSQKKCLSGETLAIQLDEIQIDDKLHPIEELVEIMNHEVKCLKRSRIPNVKLDEIQIDDTLHPIEEPVEIMNHEVKRLKRSRIPNVKVRWSFRRGPEYT